MLGSCKEGGKDMGQNLRSQEITKVIKNEPLIEIEPSLEGLSSNLDTKAGGSIYYGTGLTTPKAIAVGLPFDVLGMILVAEKLRQTGKMEDIYHHVADTHAKTNTWIDPKEVDTRAKIVRESLLRAANNLGLSCFHVMLSSEFDTSPEYQQLLKEFGQSTEHEYVIREMADMEWYRTQKNLALKIGWIIQARETDLGFDERLFDREYKTFKGPLLSFIYTKPGRTFDKGRPKASPYIQIEGETRLLLEKGENVKEKMKNAIETFGGDQFLGGARKHLENIVRLYEKLFGSFGRMPLEEKLQAIIDKVTA